MAGKKKVAGGKKKGGKKAGGKEKPKAGLAEGDLVLPIIPTIKGAAAQCSVALSDTRTLTRMVEHYNYSAALQEVGANGSTLLHLSARKNAVDMLEKLLQYKLIDVNALELRSMGGFSAIHLCCINGNADAVRALLNAGADMHIKADSATGERPLHSCCMHDQLSCARVLLEAGCMPDLRDNFGHNAAFWAQQKGHTHLISALELPPPHAATAAEFFAIMMERTKGKFVLPSLTGKKGGGKDAKGKDGKGGKKKK
jgi:hypothetical protein